MAVKVFVSLNPQLSIELLSQGSIKKFSNFFDTVDYLKRTRPVKVEINRRGLSLAQTLDMHMPQMSIVVMDDAIIENMFKEVRK